MTIRMKPQSQWCLKTTYFDEIMALPDTVEIEALSFIVGVTMKSHAKQIPATLKKLGVTYLRETAVSLESQGRFENMSRADMIKNITKICNSLGLKYSTVRVRSMNVKVGNDTAIFRITTKAMHPEEDKRKKLKVLGMSSHTGNANNIISAISATKFQCTFDVVPIRTVICSES